MMCDALLPLCRARGTYALVPARDGFDAAGHRVVCLLLGTTGPVFGPLGYHHEMGMRIPDTATLQKQDCLERISDRAARLVSCQWP